MRYCNGYPYLGAEDEGLGLLFTGDNGVGKTHLAVVRAARAGHEPRARAGSSGTSTS